MPAGLAKSTRSLGPGHPPAWPSAGRKPLRALCCRRSSPASAAAAPRPPPCLGQGVDQRGTRILRQPAHRPEAVLLRRSRWRGRADAGDDGRGVRLARDADQVADRRGRGGSEQRRTCAGLDRLTSRSAACCTKPCDAAMTSSPSQPRHLGNAERGSPWRCLRAGGRPTLMGQNLVKKAAAYPPCFRPIMTARRAGLSRVQAPLAPRAPAVAPPTAAIRSPANARASRPNSSNFSRTARTALTEVNPIHS